jgi:tetratricopeptide (TPR) repeat protein
MRAEERFRLFDSVCTFLRRVSVSSGLVVALDDLHWADPSTLLLLVHAVRLLEPARVLIVGTLRTVGVETAEEVREAVADLVREPSCELLELSGLPRGDVERLLRAMTGHEPRREVTERVYGLTGGNPFFVRELARGLTAGGFGPGFDDGDRIPATVRGALHQRLSRLSEPARRLLEAASVLEGDFPVAVAAGMVGTEVLTALRLLEEAHRAGLTEPTAPGESRFTHALFRETVESEVGEADRVRLHRAAAQAIEQYYGAGLEPHLAELARHWRVAAVAGERPIAAGWAGRAAEAAARMHAFADAAHLYRMALDTGGSELDEEQRYRWHLGLAEAQYSGGRFADSLAACQRAAEVARRLERPDLLAEIALVMPDVGTGEAPALLVLCETALDRLGDGPAAVRARLLARRSHAGAFLGADAGSVDRWSREALALAEGSGDPTVLDDALRARHIACAAPEGAAERRAIAERRLALARAENDPLAEMWAGLWLIDVDLAQGRLNSAEARLGGIEWCVEQLGRPTARWQLLRARAAIAQARGRFAEALALADEAVAVHRRGEPGQRAPDDAPGPGPGSPEQGIVLELRAALQGAVRHHTGWRPDDGPVPPLFGPAPRPFATMGIAGRAWGCAERGDLEEAARWYQQLGPPPGWVVAPMLRLMAPLAGLWAALIIGGPGDVAELYELLRPYESMHGTAVGAPFYGGPVALSLGRACLALGRLDEAIDRLSAAEQVTSGNGARGFAVEAAVGASHCSAAPAARPRSWACRPSSPGPRRSWPASRPCPGPAGCRPGSGKSPVWWRKGCPTGRSPTGWCCPSAPPRTTSPTSSPSWASPAALRSPPGWPPAGPPGASRPLGPAVN